MVMSNNFRLDLGKKTLDSANINLNDRMEKFLADLKNMNKFILFS